MYGHIHIAYLSMEYEKTKENPYSKKGFHNQREELTQRLLDFMDDTNSKIMDRSRWFSVDNPPWSVHDFMKLVLQ